MITFIRENSSSYPEADSIWYADIINIRNFYGNIVKHKIKQCYPNSCVFLGPIHHYPYSDDKRFIGIIFFDSADAADFIMKASTNSFDTEFKR